MILDMCGIVAYRGAKDASGVVFDGLKSLEYRGYDSWGVAVVSGSKVHVVKKVGKISDTVALDMPASSVGVAHTRWATHGGVSEVNAHPHIDCSGGIAVVHNGIIENYQELKRLLSSHRFVSETDTELIPHYIEELLKSGLGFVDAVRKVAGLIKGRSAFVAVDASGMLVAARKGTPLIVGRGAGEFFVASDISAFLPHTKSVQYLDDGELVVVGDDTTFFEIESGRGISKRVVLIDWNPETAEKGGYEHFLIKEIMEQKNTLWRAINQNDSKIMAVASDINSAFGSFLVGCGTAGKVCMAGEYLFSRVAGRHINCYVASEFPNFAHYLTPKSLVIAVSQSGETADVLEAIEAARRSNSKVISLLNVFGSTMMRASDEYFMVNAGAERAVVSTKATTAQLAVLTLLAYAAAGRLQEGKLLLMDVAEAVNDMLNPRYEAHIMSLAASLKAARDVYIIGRSLNYAMALEAAIKLQETAYIHAQGFAGGELKHGPLALIEKGTPCIVLVANDESRDELLSNAMEVKARGGFIVGISP
ncbi:glutamine--fructose-6-phosphate transaminase (isomerizing), partial [Candidatus Woesearchaeota archaeon]|nr:glutamine--fructose-6-phosphate transaminase (isomerizing) [Candidatus Woesearchaeota archaeon]